MLFFVTGDMAPILLSNHRAAFRDNINNKFINHLCMDVKDKKSLNKKALSTCSCAAGLDGIIDAAVLAAVLAAVPLMNFDTIGFQNVMNYLRIRVLLIYKTI